VSENEDLGHAIRRLRQTRQQAIGILANNAEYPQRTSACGSQMIRR
jgi:hypothetical protein